MKDEITGITPMCTQDRKTEMTVRAHLHTLVEKLRSNLFGNIFLNDLFKRKCERERMNLPSNS